MKTKIAMTLVYIICLVLVFGCGVNSTPNNAEQSQGAGEPIGTWKFAVDVDKASLAITPALGTNTVTTVDGHTVEIYNGPGGCNWDGGTNTLSCEIIVRNLDSDECMFNVRTRLHNSTNPSAFVANADYSWPGPSIVPNTSLPIDESGYCITEPSPSASGSVEGCSNTWQESISSGAIASQTFSFTNVPAGSYTFYVQIMADYQACSAPAGMARISKGCFYMGDAFSEGFSDERPVHNVCITSDFYMDVHEVTNSEYAACVAGSGCNAPGYSSSASRAFYYGNPIYDDYPVITSVDWNRASDYCTWASKRLPTEAEWEYAARGGLSGKRYPHGDSLSCSDANYYRADLSAACWDYGGLDNDTHQVQSYAPNGYGLYDMTGNAREYVNDWYQSDYYDVSPINDPPGAATGSLVILRGGFWANLSGYMRIVYRFNTPPSGQGNIGIRCAGD